jgi:hypothetical protein
LLLGLVIVVERLRCTFYGVYVVERLHVVESLRVDELCKSSSFCAGRATQLFSRCEKPEEQV